MNIPHRFYLKSKKEQNSIQLLIGLAALAINLCILLISWFSGMYLLIIFSIAITLSIIAPFIDTPSLKEQGHLNYYSPLFIAEKEKNGTIKVHGGTLFDYVFVIDKDLNGRHRTNFILQQYLEGLLKLMEKYEHHPTDIKIIGTSYIINERTANKIGFKVVQTDFIQQLILVYNYLNLMASFSIAKARIAFPNITDIKTFESSIKELIERKEYIEKLNDRLKHIPFSKH